MPRTDNALDDLCRRVRDYGQDRAAREIGISRQLMSMKMNGHRQWWYHEIEELARVVGCELRLSERHVIARK